MSDKPLISIITIFLDAEKFIREAIESVFAQTYDHWELLLVDDGSIDASTRIALEYAQPHPGRVRYLEHAGHKNRGQSASRNLGLAAARGELVALLDADDVWLPHKLERQVAILEAHPEAVMVYGPAKMWHSWTGNASDAALDFVPEKHAGLIDTVVNPPVLFPLLLRDECVEPFPSGVLVRREAMERVGGFEEGLRLFDDTILYAKLCLDAPVFVSSECWYKYRQHPESVTHLFYTEKAGQYQGGWQIFLERLALYTWKRGVTDERVWEVLQEWLGYYPHPLFYRGKVLARKLGPVWRIAVLIRRRFRERFVASADNQRRR
jgi:glycosyltransferase involved in cell wall biosynthesis